MTFTELAAAGALGLGLLGLSAGTASAVTVTFGDPPNQGGGLYTEAGFSFDDLRRVGGPCPDLTTDSNSDDPSCGAVNKLETSTLTYEGGLAFTLSSLFVTLEGENAILRLTSELGSFDVTDVLLGDTAGGFADGFIDFTGLTSVLTNVTSIAFSFIDDSDSGLGGNARFDNLEVAPVPVPAAGLLLLTALGGLGLWRRRQAAA